MKKKVIYYLSVDKKFISDWEYYQVELDMLKDLFAEVVVCNTFWDLLKNIKGSHLIYCWWWHKSILALILGKLFQKKVLMIGAIHVFDLSGVTTFFKNSLIYKFSMRFAMAFADCNLFISFDQFNQVTTHFKVKNPVTLRSSLKKSDLLDIKNILLERKKNYNKRNLNEQDKIHFLTTLWHTNNQHIRKGIYESLDGISYLNTKTKKKFEWSIIGKDGDGILGLRKRIKDLKLEDKVKVYVDVSPSEKVNFYLNSDLYIQPSWCEGFGNAVLEAMALGVPALVSRYTSQPEVVGNTGYIAMDMRGKTIGKLLLNFVSLKNSQRNECSKNVLQRVEKEFSYKIRLKKLKKILRENSILT